MAFRVKTSTKAKRDLDAILGRLLAREAGEAGWRWFQGLREAVASLAHSPKRCPLAPENGVPGIFPLPSKSSGSTQSMCRAIAGDRGNRELVLFDYRVGQGKGSFFRTVAAVRGPDTAFGIARFGPDLVAEQVGEWALVYGDRRLLTIEEIEALVAAVTH